ncbi:unnamed protein product [Soboliphyme baturini]|uniref:Mid1-interacting protein 1-B n=1 Tax=Soboliphyme baturini TaxID=241478 RepID=A0A183IFF2_9BILA|nr:unnamed protein product [Soboliphyme baturini]
MDKLSDASASFACLRYGECTASSIVKALDNFLVAVQQMKDIVMVPSRLLDMTSTITEVQHESGGDGYAALVPFVDAENAAREYPLFTFYQMLQMIRNELVSGTSCGDGDGDATTGHEQCQVDEQMHRMANAFQQHLQGLFTILRQLTNTAVYLSKRYQDDVDKRDVPQSSW